MLDAQNESLQRPVVRLPGDLRLRGGRLDRCQTARHRTAGDAPPCTSLVSAACTSGLAVKFPKTHPSGMEPDLPRASKPGFSSRFSGVLFETPGTQGKVLLRRDALRHRDIVVRTDAEQQDEDG